MRGLVIVAALLALVTSLLSAPSRADAASDACTSIQLAPGVIVTGAGLAACVRMRMLRSGPGHTQLTIDDRTTRLGRGAGRIHGVDPSDRLVTSIRSVTQWGVVDAERIEDEDGTPHAAWHLAPVLNARFGAVLDVSGTALHLSTDELPLQLDSTLRIGRMRVAYVQQWGDWFGPAPLSCASCTR